MLPGGLLDLMVNWYSDCHGTCPWQSDPSLRPWHTNSGYCRRTTSPGTFPGPCDLCPC